MSTARLSQARGDLVRLSLIAYQRPLCQPHCDRVLSQHANFVFTCKPDSHETLDEWVEDFSRIGG